MIAPDLDRALAAQYVGRPEKLADVRANIEAWQRLVAISRMPSPYAGLVRREP